jgi:hypothetical protein
VPSVTMPVQVFGHNLAVVSPNAPEPEMALDG